MKHRILFIGLAMMLAGWLVTCTGRTSPPTPIEYSRTGGIAGFDDLLVIQPSGAAMLTRRGESSEFVLDTESLARLQSLLDDAQFARLKAEYLPSGQGADLFTYVITYRGHTVRTMDTAVPQALQPALDLLNQIVADHSTMSLAPADSESPAAGICAQATGDVAIIEIGPDAASPRCVKATGDQHLKVVNHTDKVVQIQFADVQTQIQPGAEYSLDRPFGSYLEPGVHRLSTSAYGQEGGAEIWLVD